MLIEYGSCCSLISGEELFFSISLLLTCFFLCALYTDRLSLPIGLVPFAMQTRFAFWIMAEYLRWDLIPSSLIGRASTLKCMLGMNFEIILIPGSYDAARLLY